MPVYQNSSGQIVQALRSDGENQHILDMFQKGNNLDPLQMKTVSKGDWLVFNNNPDDPEFEIFSDSNFKANHEEYVEPVSDIPQE